ncbi:unnamed protein product [Nezara viridula]|uniref:Uncharacterized protein n=1 Tax=Nezara viridula TaxID=85310 RepID=A0A9P0H1C1_NEZVI|nr:unnamed protein product [Nezara viridula]
MFWNVGGLTADKFTEWKTIITKEDADLYGIVETGSSTENIQFYQLPGYQTYKLQRSRQVASGIIVAAKSSLKDLAVSLLRIIPTRCSPTSLSLPCQLSMSKMLNTLMGEGEGAPPPRPPAQIRPTYQQQGPRLQQMTYPRPTTTHLPPQNVMRGPEEPNLDLSHLSAEERALIQNVMAKAKDLDKTQKP